TGILTRLSLGAVRVAGVGAAGLRRPSHARTLAPSVGRGRPEGRAAFGFAGCPEPASLCWCASSVNRSSLRAMDVPPGFCAQNELHVARDDVHVRGPAPCPRAEATARSLRRRGFLASDVDASKHAPAASGGYSSAACFLSRSRISLELAEASARNA